MIDVKQRTLRAFEQHGRATLECAMNLQADVIGQCQQARRNDVKRRKCFVDISARLAIHQRQTPIRIRDARFHQRAQPGGIAQIEHAHATPRDLVFIRRTNTATSRANRLARRAGTVHQLVVRHYEMRALADVQPPAHIDAVGHQCVDFAEEFLGIEHHTVADSASHTRMHDAAGDLVQHNFLVTDVHRVAGVGTTLIAHHPVGAFGQHIHQLAFPFITPLGTNHHQRASRRVEHRISLPWRATTAGTQQTRFGSVSVAKKVSEIHPTQNATRDRRVALAKTTVPLGVCHPLPADQASGLSRSATNEKAQQSAMPRIGAATGPSL